jgi:hypothetical protein
VHVTLIRSYGFLRFSYVRTNYSTLVISIYQETPWLKKIVGSILCRVLLCSSPILSEPKMHTTPKQICSEVINASQTVDDARRHGGCASIWIPWLGLYPHEPLHIPKSGVKWRLKRIRFLWPPVPMKYHTYVQCAWQLSRTGGYCEQQCGKTWKGWRL